MRMKYLVMLRETARKEYRNHSKTLLYCFNPSVTSVTPPLYFALQNTGEEDNTFLCNVLVLPPYCWATPRNVTEHDRGEFHTFVLLLCLTPSPCGHSPYIPLRKHRGRGLKEAFYVLA